jgi:early secretory antigenic target protein ESAT-6
MPFDQIKVTVSDLQTASGQFDARAAELESLLQQVQSQIEALQSTWQGQAAFEFVNLMQQWNQDVLGIHDVLSTVSQHMKLAASGYSETDSGIARGFQVG